MVADRPKPSDREALYRRARTGHLRQGDTVLLRELLDGERDFLVLSRMTRAADPAVRGWALLRLSALEPARVERHLAVHRHCVEVGDRHRALEALDVADALAAADRRVMWARLEFHRESPVEELAAIVAYYELHFAGDPVLGMVRERCRRRMDGVSPQGEPVVVLDPAQPAGARGAQPVVEPAAQPVVQPVVQPGTQPVTRPAPTRAR